MFQSSVTQFTLRNSRVNHFRDELVFAIGRLDSATLKSWGKRSSTRLLLLTGQRIGGVARLVALLARAGGGELIGLVKAARHGVFVSHLGNRTAAAIDGSLSIGGEGVRLITAIAHNLLKNPKATAPGVIGALLGFSAGSGGLDGNGGIPDLDLLAGIGAHRSPITHTIVAGILVEGLLLAIVDLAAEVHGRLPKDHDPLWDKLAEIGRPLANNLAIGTSAGLAWHLMVDAFVQPGSYHGLPVEMPLEAHQAVFAANGLAEGVHGASKVRRDKPLMLSVSGSRAKTTGRKIVDGIGSAFAMAVGTVTSITGKNRHAK